MESYEEILTRMEETYEQESGHKPRDVSDTGLRLRVLAGELYRLEAELQWIRRQALPHTASGEWLDRHGEMRGVSRKEAAKATGTLRFTRYLPLSFDVVIPKGTVCALSGEDPVEYETTEDGVLTAGNLTVNVPAQAAAGGTAGNAAAGRVTTLVTQVTGVDYVTNPAAFSGGREREEDENYRTRVLEAYRDLPSGSNAAYYRDAALRWEGISAAEAKPRANGANTVAVYVWGDGAAPSASTIAGLQDDLNRRREVGVTVTVQAASQSAVNVSLRIKTPVGGDASLAKAEAERAVRDYFARLTLGSPVYLLDLQRAVLDAVPLTKLEMGTTMRDMAGNPAVLPVLGSFVVEEVA